MSGGDDAVVHRETDEHAPGETDSVVPEGADSVVPVGTDSVVAVAAKPADNSLLGVLCGCALGAVVFLAPVVGVRRGWTDLSNQWAELCVLASCVLAGGLIVGRWMAQRKREQLDASAKLETSPESASLPENKKTNADLVPSSVTQEVDLAEVDAAESKTEMQPPSESDVENSTNEAQPASVEKLTGTAATAVMVKEKEREQTKVEKRIRLIISPERTKRTGGLVFLILYINCAVLCQRLSFGMFSITPDVALILKAMGAAITMTGAIYIAKSDRLPQKQRVVHPHYFGVLIILLGVPLVFSAWFPLLALPGIFVGMLWSLAKPGDNNTIPELPKAQSRKLIPFLY